MNFPEIHKIEISPVKKMEIEREGAQLGFQRKGEGKVLKGARREMVGRE
jgi:hypothetical protein